MIKQSSTTFIKHNEQQDNEGMMMPENSQKELDLKMAKNY